ncbi:MAG: UDP-N-acetylglucosamine 1-carboxyvinyltransferase [Eubacteriales bacterium]|nr:UDP-N-acetylglucosamine 1-carboxyvinyltransferase [Eubacteriales bacterium]
MDFWTVRGGKKLYGSCRIQGSKNASLPILAASVLACGETELDCVPRLRDIDAALRILRHLGCRAEQDGNSLYIDARGLVHSCIPEDLMHEMRSSVIFMGALLARCGEARLSPPGGCRLGKRPIDLHLKALRQLGAEVEERGGEILCRAEKLRGTVIRLPFPSVGATENTMLAASAAEGETVIEGAAREPEIEALQDYLNAMGCRVCGAGTGRIVIEPRGPRGSVRFRIQPDRIAAATLACACAAAGGEIELLDAEPAHFSTVLHFLKEAGCDIITKQCCLTVRSDGRLRAVGTITTEPYPGFPTDAQPVLMAALLRAEGVTRIRETIFENRFRQVPELRKLGAEIRLEGQTAEIRGVAHLTGAELEATDLRGGAAMLVAGLTAEGETRVRDEGHIARGYERFDRVLSALGAEVRRTDS